MLLVLRLATIARILIRSANFLRGLLLLKKTR